MSGLMQMSLLVTSEAPLPLPPPSEQNDSPSLPSIYIQNALLSLVPIPPMQNDSFSRPQVTEWHSELPGQSGMFLKIQERKSRRNLNPASERSGILFASECVPETVNDAPQYAICAQTILETVTSDELNSRFIIATNRQETLAFIAANDLLSVLLESEKHINDAFGESSLKTLAIVEDDEGYRTLFCFVVFPGTLVQAQEALRSFDRDWWLKSARRFGSRLNFDFELV